MGSKRTPCTTLEGNKASRKESQGLDPDLADLGVVEALGDLENLGDVQAAGPGSGSRPGVEPKA